MSAKRKTPYAINDRVKFGQHKDRLVQDIAKQDPKYIHWLWAVHECEFTNEVWAVVRKAEAAAKGKKP